MIEVLCVLLGVFLGAVLQRSHDGYKLRKDEAHKFVLAFETVREFEYWVEYPALWQDNSSNLTVNIDVLQDFVHSHLAYVLPSEIKDDFKNISDLAKRFNQMEDRSVEKMTEIYNISFTNHPEEVFFHKTVALNALLYVRSKRYLWFGLNPNEQELHERLGKRGKIWLQGMLLDNSNFSKKDLLNSKKKNHTFFE